jgi:hypothetical protein
MHSMVYGVMELQLLLVNYLNIIFSQYINSNHNISLINKIKIH